MRRRPRTLALTLLVAVTAGCHRAGPYGPPAHLTTPAAGGKAAPAATPAPQEPLDPTLLWEDAPARPPDGVRIVFVHPAKDPDTWRRLPQTWNAPLCEPEEVAALVGLPPLASAALAANAAEVVVRVKVPLGLDDPAPHVPASNPLTLGKWLLGRRLFFDDTWLQARADAATPGVSCATCHRPAPAFADRERVHADGFNTPTLINCVFNERQFWDGRVAALEEVVQSAREDEREPSGAGPFHHAWHGAVGRLREQDSYLYQFEQVFGTRPTQDAVGRALATYMRTLLAGNSLHDRAQERARRANRELAEADYADVLAEAGATQELGRPGAKPAETAAQLYRGYRLFFDRDSTDRVNCSACHGGGQFTDEGFHNLGWEEASPPGRERGRFATMPLGSKDRRLIDAFKTPTLRSLLRTGPYYHNGREVELRNVVEHHSRRGAYLDPLLRGPWDHVRGDDLKPEEVSSLVLFLHALNGDPIPANMLPLSAR
jgi:cytochrome c peroxidase